MSFNIIKNTLETQENGVLIIENDVYRINPEKVMVRFDHHFLSTDQCYHLSET